MSQTTAFVFNTVLIFLEGCMLLFLANGFFTRKRSNRFVYISFTGLSALVCIVLYFYGDSSVVKMSVSACIYISWILLCYSTTVTKCLFSVLFWLAYLVIGDNSCLALFSIAVKAHIQNFLNDPLGYYFMCFSAKIMEMLGVVFLYTWLKHHFTHAYAAFSEWLRIMIFPIATLSISRFLLRIYYFAPDMAWELTVCNAIILLVDVVSFFFLNYLERQQEVTRDNIILRQSMKTELDNVEAWRKAYDGQRKQTHDFQNQLLVIHGLVKQSAPTEDILNYIEHLQHIDLPSAMIVKTHRTAVDIILNQKNAIAESRDIRFVSQLDDLSQFPLPNDALITVLSNLIDNAIEACEKVEMAEDRCILLKMRVEEQAAFLYIENSTAGQIKIQNNRIVSTKKNQIAHGYGLQNVMSVLEQNKGTYSLNFDSKRRVFSFSAQIEIDT